MKDKKTIRRRENLVKSKILHILNQRYLIQQLLIRELKGRYAGSSIGIYWSLINPIVMFVVYTYVFSVILKVRLGDEPGITNFALYLFCGYIVWNGFQEIVQRTTTVISDNALLIKNVSFPSKVIPVSIGLNSIINECLGVMILILGTTVILGFFPTYLWFLIPLMILQLFFSLGLGFIFSSIQVFYRDTAQFVNVFLMIWMFGTPLFYPEKMIPPQFKLILDINPMAYLIRMFRWICLQNQFPRIEDIAVFSVLSFVILLIGYSVYTKYYCRFIDQL